MKCEIIRDLFPSYIDGLTSKESNEAVEEHLEKCKECRDYLEAMKKEIVSAKYVERRKEEIKKDVEPLRKLKRVTKQMVAGTVLFCIVAIGIALGAYEGYYGTGVQPNSEDVKITCEKIDSVVRIGFQPQKEGVYLEAMVKEENEKTHIRLVERRIRPFEKDKRITNNAYYEYIYIGADQGKRAKRQRNVGSGVQRNNENSENYRSLYRRNSEFKIISKKDRSKANLGQVIC